MKRRYRAPDASPEVMRVAFVLTALGQLLDGHLYSDEERALFFDALDSLWNPTAGRRR